VYWRNQNFGFDLFGTCNIPLPGFFLHIEDIKGNMPSIRMRIDVKSFK